ncbi:MAG: cation diffusion facilitator family transporter [Rickettsiaceae bacterium]
MIQTKDETLIRYASYISVITAFFVMLAKIYGWALTDSQSMRATLVDSLLDISSSLINVIAIRFSLTPPDENHRFGHEKFQDLAIFSQSIFFFLSGLFTLFSATKALYAHRVPDNGELGIDTMYFCIVLTLGLVIFQSYVIKKTNSKIIAADKLHYFSDLLTNVAVVVSLYLSNKFWYIDAVAGIAISLYIVRGSFLLFREAIRNLADEEFQLEDRNKIINIINSVPEAKGVHELKTRCAGDKPFIQFHLELNGKLTLAEAHQISDNIIDKLIELFPNAEIIIHQDPL